MCGIVAISAASELDIAQVVGRIGNGLSALESRGPDGHRISVSGDHCAVLGHARLAVTVPGDPLQPFANEDGTIQAAVNGEFYDYKEQRAALERLGHRFATGGDSELAVHLYEEYGPDFVSRLNGEYAIILYDQERATLLAYRDPFGTKPLCYAQKGRELLVASKAKALFAMGVEARWDETSLNHAFSCQYLRPERTLFSGVQMIPPGKVVVARRGSLEVKTYTSIETTAPIDGPEQLDKLIRAAVLRRIPADSPWCLTLSGGIDSSVVAAVAASCGPASAYTVCFDEGTFNEAEIAREVAEHLGLLWRPVELSGAVLALALPHAAAAAEGLAINGHLAAKHLLFRQMRADGFKAVLSGEGSDELLYGYAHLIADAGGGLEKLNAKYASSQDMLPTVAGAKSLPTFLQAKVEIGNVARPLLKLAPLSGNPAKELAKGLGGGFKGAARSAEIWRQLVLCGYILTTLADGQEMAHSIEGRLPFLDRHLAAAALATPFDKLVEGDIDKAMLRSAFRQKLPRTLIERPKHPFSAPPLIADPAASAVYREMISDAGWGSHAPLDRKSALGLLQLAPTLDAAGQNRCDSALHLALTCEAIGKAFHVV